MTALVTDARIVNLRDLARDGRRPVLPPDVVDVSRPSRWGNPYKIGERFDIEETDPAGRLRRRLVTIDRELALGLFRGFAVARLAGDPTWLEPLRGQRLACWCAPLPCHAGILLELLEAGG